MDYYRAYIGGQYIRSFKPEKCRSAKEAARRTAMMYEYVNSDFPFYGDDSIIVEIRYRSDSYKYRVNRQVFVEYTAEDV